MSAMEKMLEKTITTVLSHMNLDVEALKKDITTRIQNFERNVETLNNTLIAHHQALTSLEQKLDLIMVHLGVEPSTAVQIPPLIEAGKKE